MAEGFKIAEGFVAVHVTLDERQADEAGAQASERVAKAIRDSPEIKAAAEEAGKKTGETLGEEAGKSAEQKLAASKSRITDVMDGAGRESGTKFGGSFSEAAISAAGVSADKVLSGGKGLLGDTTKLGDEALKEGEKVGEKAGAGLLSRFSSLLGGLGGAIQKNTPKAISAVQDFAEKAGETISTIGENIMPIVVGVIAELSPLIGAALNAGIVGALGTGVIALGIVGQIKSPEVLSALKDLGSDLSSTLTRDTQVFQQPLVTAIDMIHNALVGLLDSIDFSSFAKELAPLAAGLSGMIANIGPGLNEALQASLPILDVLAKELPNIGNAISGFFHQLAAGGQGAQEGFRTLLILIEGLIEYIGFMIRVFSDAYASIIQFGDGMSDVAQKLVGWVPILGEISKGAHEVFDTIRNGNDAPITMGKALDQVGGSMVQLGLKTTLLAGDFNGFMQQINATAMTTDVLAGAMSDKLFTSLMNSDQATLGFAEAQTRLTDTLKKNSNELDIHSAKGQQDREAILNAVSANIRLYDTMIQTGYSAQDAAAAYDQNTAALRKQLSQAGLTGKQIDSLIGKYGSVPDSVNTNITLKGLTQAINDLNTTLRLINGLHDKTVTISMRYTQSGTANARGISTGFQRFGGITSYADGGTTPAGIYSTLSGAGILKFAEPETGGEAYIPRNISDVRAAEILSVAAGWHGMSVVPNTPPPPPIAPTSPVYAHTFVLALEGQAMQTYVLRTIDANPTLVSQAAAEGDRRRAGALPGFQPQGR